MGITQQPKQQSAPVPVAEIRLFNALVRDKIVEISDATKQSYKQKAQAQVKELEPWTKKGEYKDIAKRAVQRREKGLEKVKKGLEHPDTLKKKKELEEYGDTAKGQKMLTKVQKRAVDRVVSKRADTDPAYAKKHSDTANRAWERMTDKDLEEGAFKNEMHAKAESMSLEDFVEQFGYLFSPGEAEQFWHAINDVAECNMSEAGEYCPKHGLDECGLMEYTGNWTNFGLEESDELAQLKKLALGK